MRLTLVEGAHETLQLLPESGTHTVELVCTLTSPGSARGRGHCCAVNTVGLVKQIPTGWTVQPRQFVAQASMMSVADVTLGAGDSEHLNSQHAC